MSLYHSTRKMSVIRQVMTLQWHRLQVVAHLLSRPGLCHLQKYWSLCFFVIFNFLQFILCLVGLSLTGLNRQPHGLMTSFLLSSVLEEFPDSAAQTLLRLAPPPGMVLLGELGLYCQKHQILAHSCWIHELESQRRWVCLHLLLLLGRDLVLPDCLERF